MMLSNTIKLQTGVTLAAVTAARQTSGSRGARAARPGIPEFWKPPELIWLVAAAATKSPQSCPTPYDPIDGSPPGSSIHGIFQARVLEWGAAWWSPLHMCVAFLPARL